MFLLYQTTHEKVNSRHADAPGVMLCEVGAFSQSKLSAVTVRIDHGHGAIAVGLDAAPTWVDVSIINFWHGTSFLWPELVSNLIIYIMVFGQAIYVSQKKTLSYKIVFFWLKWFKEFFKWMRYTKLGLFGLSKNASDTRKTRKKTWDVLICTANVFFRRLTT